MRRRAASPLRSCRPVASQVPSSFQGTVTHPGTPRVFTFGLSGGVYTPRLSESPPTVSHTHADWAYTFIYFGIGRKRHTIGEKDVAGCSFSSQIATEQPVSVFSLKSTSVLTLAL